MEIVRMKMCHMHHEKKGIGEEERRVKARERREKGGGE